MVEVGGVRAGLLPFVSERLLVRRLFQEDEVLHRTYAEALRRVLDNLKSPLLLGHFAVEGRGPGEGSSSSTWWEATPSPGRACLWRSATSPWATSTGNSR